MERKNKITAVDKINTADPAINDPTPDAMPESGTAADSKWQTARRLFSGNKLPDHRGPQFSPDQLAHFLELVPDNREISVRQVIKDNDLACSAGYLESVFIRSTKRMSTALLLKYRDFQTGSIYLVLNFSYAVPKQLKHPVTGNRLQLIGQSVLPFYRVGSADYILEKGCLLPFRDSNNPEQLQALLNPRIEQGALFTINPYQRKQHHFHIIKLFVDSDPVTCCGLDYGYGRPYRVANCATNNIAAQRICGNCLPGAIKKYNQVGNLRPQRIWPKLSNTTAALNVFRDANTLNSVKEACTNNGISSDTFSEWRKEHRDLYNWVRNQKFSI